MTASAQIESRRSRTRLSVAVWGITAALMLLPLAAIRGVDAAAWNPPGDFVFLAILLVAVGAAWEVVARVQQRRAYLVAIIIALSSGLLSIWINLAVGIIGSENHPANWIYAGVIAVAIIGAALARFRPRGMASAMSAAATAQIVAFVVALASGLSFTGPITVFFTALWLMSAWLFLNAAQS